MSKDDEISKLKNGDRATWRKVGNDYFRQFVSCMNSKLEADADDAKDAYQNAVEKLLNELEYGSLTKFKKDLHSYLFSNGIGRLIDISRKNYRLDKLCEILFYLNGEEDDSPAPFEDGENPLLIALQKCLDELPPDEKEFISLCFQNKKHSMAEIAYMADISSEDYASLKKFRILKKLEKMMNDLGFFGLWE
jgi:RNA polymerase sigma factor (sigma-70 family)